MIFSTAIDILAPSDRVWAVMSDVERWHEWTASITSIIRLDAGPLQNGSRVRIKQPKLAPGNWTITAWEPGRRFSWMMSSPGVRVTGSHGVAPTASGTRADLTLHFEGILGVILARVFQSLTSRYMNMEAEGLKRRSECADHILRQPMP